MFVILVVAGNAVLDPVQDDPKGESKPGWLLNQVFPNPTGDNGLEDLLIAAEMLDANRAYQRYEERTGQGVATLQDKRAAITGCRAVLVRLRVGLERERFDWPKQPRRPDAPFEDWSHYRRLARLLRLEQEVHFADGRETQAIDSFRDGYRLGQVLEQRLLVNGLVALACKAIAMQPLAQRLDQLDHDECRYLQRMCSDLLDRPSSLIDVIEGELQYVLAHLEALTADEALDLLSEQSELEGEQPDAGTVALRKRFEEDPEFFEREVRRAREVAGTYFAELLEQVRKPPLERVIPDARNSDDGSFGWQLIGPSIEIWESALVQFDRARARLQVLTVHAAILEYRWWHGVTPADLPKLNLGDIATDPFTGKPLIYKRLGDYRYKLYSAGANKEDDDGNFDSDVVLSRDM